MKRTGNSRKLIEAVVSCVRDGWTYGEIAKRYGFTKSKVAGIVARARRNGLLEDRPARPRQGRALHIWLDNDIAAWLDGMAADSGSKAEDLARRLLTALLLDDRAAEKDPLHFGN